MLRQETTEQRPNVLQVKTGLAKTPKLLLMGTKVDQRLQRAWESTECLTLKDINSLRIRQRPTRRKTTRLSYQSHLISITKCQPRLRMLCIRARISQLPTSRTTRSTLALTTLGFEVNSGAAMRQISKQVVEVSHNNLLITTKVEITKWSKIYLVDPTHLTKWIIKGIRIPFRLSTI